MVSDDCNTSTHASKLSGVTIIDSFSFTAFKKFSFLTITGE
jgi:glycosylphosphatidylinositol transamidase (GPIT) subunit GPI8